jgi:hypothetical protein
MTHKSKNGKNQLHHVVFEHQRQLTGNFKKLGNFGNKKKSGQVF